MSLFVCIITQTDLKFHSHFCISYNNFMHLPASQYSYLSDFRHCLKRKSLFCYCRIDLYVGDSIEGKVNRIKWKINHHAGTVSIYVIAFASNRQNLLDIIPAWELMQKSYPGKKQMQIIGLAKGYAEALELVRSIIDEVYQNTGDVDVKSYLRGRKRRRQV